MLLYLSCSSQLNVAYLIPLSESRCPGPSEHPQSLRGMAYTVVPLCAWDRI